MNPPEPEASWDFSGESSSTATATDEKGDANPAMSGRVGSNIGSAEPMMSSAQDAEVRVLEDAIKRITACLARAADADLPGLVEERRALRSELQDLRAGAKVVPIDAARRRR